MLISVKFDERLNHEKVLRRDPVVHRIAKFDEDSGKAIFESLNQAVSWGQPIFPVVIDSYGGEVYGLLAILEAFRNSPIPVATVIQGKAMSCGAMLAAMGTRGHRYISPYAHVLIHHVSSSTAGIIPKIKEDVRHGEHLDKQVFEMVAEHCGHQPGFFLDRLRPREGADWYIKPSEARDLGLVDHVASPTLRVDVTASIRLVHPTDR